MDRLIISGLIGTRTEALDSLLAENGIGDNFTAAMMRDFLSQNPDGDINIELNTIGGDVIEGFEIYDLLQAEKAKGRTVKMYGKQFDSIGSIIFLAGSDTCRYAYRGSAPLIHNSWIPADALGDIALNAQVLDRISADHKASDADMLHEYLKVAGRDNRELLQKLMINETQLTDQQLLDLNFASEIISESAALRAQGIRALAFKRAESVEHYADCVLVNEGKVFLIQRALDDDFEPGSFAFPGGKIEPGELPAAAAVRELHEETGLRAQDIELLGIEDNGNGSTSHYFAVEILNYDDLEVEASEVAKAGWYDISSLPENIIKGQSDRYDSLIQKCIKMSEKLTGLEKALNALKTRFGMVEPKAMVLPLEEGDTSIFVYSDDGELEGKKAVIADGEEPTETPAPEGTHTLSDGRSITIGADGIVESVQESAAAMNEEEMQAMKEEMKTALSAMKQAQKDLASKDAEIAALQAAKNTADEETKAQILAMQNEIKELKAVVPGDDSEEESKARLVALKAQREEFKKMKPSEKRLVALKQELGK